MKSTVKTIQNKNNTLWGRIWYNRQIYALILPALIWVIVFSYIPMAGLQLAFKQFNARLGIWGSHWNGLTNYSYLVRDPQFWKAMTNTITISLQRICFQFPVPIILALLINEISFKKYKKILQTIFTFPNFLSWVVISSIMFNLLQSAGLINLIIRQFGGDPIPFLTSNSLIRPMLFITDNWKSAGWGAIIYLASISGIDQEQYESAVIDGANRFQRIIHITLPGIRETIIIMFILAVGGIMNAGFDQVFNLGNSLVLNKIDILDWYIYRRTFETSTDFGFSTAISLMKGSLNFLFLLTANQVTKYVTKSGLFV
ncbi:MAG: ABC transporter permease subunit [Treponema sp.]|jgi:putative aldouronate transport system permease protein|nr:ABC transporter permease subunit [Treponema sp.]